MTRRSGHSPSNVVKQLAGIRFPATKDDLIRHAQKGGTGAEAMDILKQMPDRTYDSMAEVTKGAGQVE